MLCSLSSFVQNSNHPRGHKNPSNFRVVTRQQQRKAQQKGRALAQQHGGAFCCFLLVEFAPLKTLPEVSGCGILKFSIFPGVETLSFSNPSLVITRPETTKCSKRALGAGQHVLFCRGEAGRG